MKLYPVLNLAPHHEDTSCV